MLRGNGWSFIHIAKCGGTALRNHLDGFEYGEFMPLGSSCAIRSPLHRMPHRRPSGRVFTVVRHPAAWLRSYWLDQSPERIGVHRFLHKFWSDDLDQFVINVCTEQPGYVTTLYEAHMRYKTIKVFRLEDGLNQVMAWLGIEPHKIPVVNASNNVPTLSNQSIELVAKTERSVIEQFGYA